LNKFVYRNLNLSIEFDTGILKRENAEVQNIQLYTDYFEIDMLRYMLLLGI